MSPINSIAQLSLYTSMSEISSISGTTFLHILNDALLCGAKCGADLSTRQISRHHSEDACHCKLHIHKVGQPAGSFFHWSVLYPKVSKQFAFHMLWCWLKVQSYFSTGLTLVCATISNEAHIKRRVQVGGYSTPKTYPSNSLSQGKTWVIRPSN